jgi:hypothetical protein
MTGGRIAPRADGVAPWLKRVVTSRRVAESRRTAAEHVWAAQTRFYAARLHAWMTAPRTIARQAAEAAAVSKLASRLAFPRLQSHPPPIGHQRIRRFNGNDLVLDSVQHKQLSDQQLVLGVELSRKALGGYVDRPPILRHGYDPNGPC